MNANMILEPTLKDILEVIKPLQEDWEVRARIIEELKDVVSSVDSLRGATVEPFGSFVSNLFTRWGDLDLSVILLNGSYIPSTGKKHKQNLLRELLKALRQKGGWHRLQFVPNARVPILKFESRHQSISCDVSIDNLQGQMKSKFLFWINQIDGRFHDMVLLVKEWAKAHDINNPKTGSLNSYSLSLLVIFHFQTCVPAILPPLREIYPRNVVDDLTGVRVIAEERIKEICNANISKYMSDEHRTINRSSLSELFISFLAKFSDIRSKAAELGICTFTGEWQDIRSTMRWLPKTYSIFIEDPFEQPENSARAVSARNLEMISEAFQMTYHRLVLANQNQSSLLSTLVRPPIFNFIAGTHVGNLSYTTNDYESTLPQIGRAMYLPLQMQHQIQHIRQEKDPNKFTKQRQGNRKNNSKSQVQSKRLEKHPNYFDKQQQESHPDNAGLEKHPSYFTKQRQESHHVVTGPEKHSKNFTNDRQESRPDKHPNNFTKQRQGNRQNNSKSQVHSMRLEKHPNYFNKQRQESHPDNAGVEKHPSYFAKQRQESRHVVTGPEKPSKNFTNDRQESRPDKHPNNVTKQRQGNRQNNSKSQVQSMRLEKHPNYFNKQRQESHPDNAGVEKHPSYFTKQRQESRHVVTGPEKHPKNFTDDRQESCLDNLAEQRLQSYPDTLISSRPAHQHYGQEKYIWRPRSDRKSKALNGH